MSQALAGRPFTFRLLGRAREPAWLLPCRTRARGERRAGRGASARSFRASRHHDRSPGRAPCRGPRRSVAFRFSAGGPRPSLSRCRGRPLSRGRAQREPEPPEARRVSYAAAAVCAARGCDAQGRDAPDGAPERAPGGRKTSARWVASCSACSRRRSQGGRPPWASFRRPHGSEPARPPRRHRPRA